MRCSLSRRMMLLATAVVAMPPCSWADDNIALMARDSFTGLRDFFSGLADLFDDLTKEPQAIVERLETEVQVFGFASQIADIVMAMQTDLQEAGNHPIALTSSHTIEQMEIAGTWVLQALAKNTAVMSPVGIMAAIGPEWMQFAGRTLGGDLSGDTMLVLIKAIVKTAALCIGFLVATDIGLTAGVPVAIGIALASIAGGAFDTLRTALSSNNLVDAFVAVYDAINYGAERARVALGMTIQAFFGNDLTILSAIGPSQTDAANRRHASDSMQPITQTRQEAWTELCTRGLCIRRYKLPLPQNDPWLNPLNETVGGVLVNPRPRTTEGNKDDLGAAALTSRPPGSRVWSIPP